MNLGDGGGDGSYLIGGLGYTRDVVLAGAVLAAVTRPGRATSEVAWS